MSNGYKLELENSEFFFNEKKDENLIPQDRMIEILTQVKQDLEKNSKTDLISRTDFCTDISNSIIDDFYNEFKIFDVYDQKIENTTLNDTYNGRKILMWEFIRDLLRSPDTNPSLVSWVDKNRLVFKIEDPSLVAEQWEIRKGIKHRKKMTFDTMARGMRDGIKRNFFAKHDGEHGCHYIRQFGERAINNCPWLKSLLLNSLKNEY